MATHEWFHQLQDIAPMWDVDPLPGTNTPTYELVADCAAIWFSDYDSYPNQSGVLCAAVQDDVDALIGAI